MKAGEIRRQRAACKKYAQIYIVGKVIRYPNLTLPIHFSVTGIKKALNQPHCYMLEKIEMVKNILQELPQATYIKSALSNDESEKDSVIFHYLSIEKNGKMFYTNLKEDKKRRIIYFYSLTERIK